MNLARSESRFETIFTILSLMLYSGGVLSVILSGGLSEGAEAFAEPESPLVRVLFSLNYLISIFLLIKKWRQAFYLLSRDRVVWVLVGLACLSIFWSFDLEMTVRRCVALVGTTMFGFYLGTAYSLRRQLQMLAWTFGISICLSLVFIFALPKYGVMDGLHSGAWRGIYTHKNVMGKMMIFSATIFTLLILNASKTRWQLWAFLMASVLFLLRSTSKSALLGLFVVFVALLIFQTLRWYFKVKVVAWTLLVFGGIATFVLVTLNANTIVAAIGRDLTFTGRTVLWSGVWDLVVQHPWLGYGYGASWNSWDSETAHAWRIVGGWKAPNSHNGFLDLLLDLGVVGTAAFAVGFVSNLIKSMILVSLSKTADGYWFLVFSVILILSNISETSLFAQNNFNWVMYVSISLTLIKEYDHLFKPQSLALEQTP
jgi:exopolysaccharide production protein ExoQ